MKKRHVAFTKIPQFRSVIRNVIAQSQFLGLDADGEPILNPNAEKPTINFSGTVKLHGSCASVSFSPGTGEIWYQSRKRIITVESDNHGFAHFCESRKNIIMELLRNTTDELSSDLSDIGIISIFGEFCGRGIQKGVAISQLPPMFVIFAVKIVPAGVASSFYIEPKGLRSADDRIFNITDFDTYSVNVDFNYPELAQAEFIDIVEKVEAQCPVGKKLGVEGIGEGVVWVGFHDGVWHVFKTKGSLHSVSHVKTVAAVDVEKVSSIMEFCDYSVTENRMRQAIDEIFISTGEEITIKRMGDFLRWVVKDIAKEEMDVLLKNELTMKDVSRSISNKARPWFQTLLNVNAGLVD